MTKLVWGAPGTRQFESGVDRGVLYIPSGVGIAWPGIKSVKESPVGGTPQPYYLDGIKYAQVAAAEEFAATINAFGAPKEFAQFDGQKRLAQGLFATQQPRRPFHFSYRSRVGDDVAGDTAGYKIHLVYNCLASPTGRDNNTVSNSVDPMDLSWNITTRPPYLALGIKPTAHLVIDTRELTALQISKVEEALYGDGDSTAYMPSQDVVVGLLT